jgi:hypothetical protein
MARMSREFSLVLLGAGLLTAGYFLSTEPDPVQAAHDEAAGGNNNGRGGTRYRTGHVMIFYAGTTRPFASSTRTSTMRGGFGRTGGTTVGG